MIGPARVAAVLSSIIDGSLPLQLELDLPTFATFDDAYQARWTVVCMAYEGWNKTSRPLGRVTRASSRSPAWASGRWLTRPAANTASTQASARGRLRASARTSAALAARHGQPLSPDEPLAEGPLRRAACSTGWRLAGYDDAADRFFAVAVRAAGDEEHVQG